MKLFVTKIVDGFMNHLFCALGITCQKIEEVIARLNNVSQIFKKEKKNQCYYGIYCPSYALRNSGKHQRTLLLHLIKECFLKEFFKPLNGKKIDSILSF